MRRDDLRRLFLSPDGVRDLLPVSDAQALDAIGRKAAFKHWLTEPCATCQPDGLYHRHINRHTGEWEGDEPIPCPHCDDRGWMPKDGVTVEWALIADDGHLVVPLSMLKGDDQ